MNLKKFLDEHPDLVDRFLKFSGSYELHGFGRYDRYELKMGSTIDGLHQLTPIWKKSFTGNDSQYFIFFNQSEKQWELHEGWKLHNGFTSSMTNGHIFCKTGLTNQFLFH